VPETDLARSIAVGTGAMRVGVGLMLLRWRRLLVRLSGAEPDDPVVSSLFAYWGVRDIGVGVAALTAALRSPDGVPTQLSAQGIADATDAALITGVTVAGRVPRGKGVGMLALAVGTAGAEFAAARWLRRRLGF
jgi:hypothetical protein